MGAQQRGSWSIGARPSGGLLGGLASVSMGEFLKVALPLVAVFALAFVLEYRAELGAERARLLTQETAAIQRGVRGVERELEMATGDLRFAAELVAAAPERDADRLAALEGSLLALLRQRPAYAQVRVIASTGRELLRVEHASGAPRVVPAGELNDQGSLAGFSRMLQLAPKQVLVSLAELGAASRPVVVLATPIDDGSGQPRGVVALDAYADRFLRGFETRADTAGVERMLVRSDGSWLKQRPQNEPGFVRAPGSGFPIAFPEVWEQSRASPQGLLETGDGLFYFHTVPLGAPSSASWTLISLVPRALQSGNAVQVATRLLVIAVPLLFALLFAAWLLAAALARRRLADEALRNAEYVRSVMMTAALDAIIVMDNTGTALEFNPMARRIFGYTLEEVRGKLVADLIIPPSYREAHRKGLARYLETREGRFVDRHIYDLVGIRKGGAEFPVELTICPIYVAGKQLFFGFLRDLSERKTHELDAGAEATSDPS